MIQSTLVIQSFGRENEYKRALFTILSYYAHTSLSLNETCVKLFTDRPQYFEPFLQGLPVQFTQLTPEKIKTMRGDIDFLHRMKIAVIEEGFKGLEGPMIYADSDTFFTADPTRYTKQVSPAKGFMHIWEYKFEIMKDWPMPSGETFRAFYNLITSRLFTLTNETEIKVHTDQVSWNAGVMMFDPSHSRFIPDVYALTDQFYPDSLNHASEQYAFSVMMQTNAEIKPCDDVIYHYWYKVKKEIADIFLNEHVTTDWARKGLNERLQEVKKWTTKMPDYFEDHIKMKRDNAIQAFNIDNYKQGLRWTRKALLQQPFDGNFIKDVLYHMKRYTTSNEKK